MFRGPVSLVISSVDVSVPCITLNNGVTIPQLGFGVFQIPPEQTQAATLTALEVGYRHIDTAQMYGNEVEVGRAVRLSGLARDEVFVTSKLSIDMHGYDLAISAFDASLDRLGLEVLDLFLIHWPMPWIVDDYVDTWKALEEIYASGRARAIGVSNFHEHHLRRILAGASVVPMVNQVEVHPYFNQDQLRAFCRAHGIVSEAWSPLAQGLVLDDPAIAAIARQYRRTAAQVVLRWHLQRGDVVFPKSVTRARVQSNFGVFDFELSAGQMAAISALDRNHRIGPHPDHFN